LLHGLVDSILDAALVTDVDLLEDDGDAKFGGELRNSLIAMLLQHIEDDESFEVYIAEGVCDVVSEATRSTRRRRIVRILKQSSG
jgi:hypothetical protein